MSGSVEITCIRCPRGCALSVSGDPGVTVEGNGCALGLQYAVTELRDPRRTLTTTVKVSGGRHPLVPVVTAAPVPKGRVMELAALLRSVEVAAPVGMGQVIAADPLGIGIAVLSSGTCERY